jgi:hypothetical protein
MQLVRPRSGIEHTWDSKWVQNQHKLDLQSSRSATNTIERSFPAELRHWTPICTDKQGRTPGNVWPMDALHRSLALNEQVAFAGVIVDAKDESAVSCYRKYGFLELPNVERRLFLPMGTVAQLFR